MNLRNALESLGTRKEARRTIAWIGGLFIAAIVGLEGYNIFRGYQTAVANTGRELDSLARVIAEQTSRTLQAVDVQLRHLAGQYGQGRLSVLSAADLRAQLAEYAVGLVQIEGFLIVQPDGAIRASSYMTPEQESRVNVSGRPLLSTLRSGANVGLYISGAQTSRFDARWMFPMGRRLETASGEFAGLVAARGRIDYFENLYRDARPDEGTAITLALQDGTLLARYPRVEAALGKRLPAFDRVLAEEKKGGPRPWRTVSSIDGLERFGALRLVGDYPLAVIVTRDTSVALAAWRSQSLWGVAHVIMLSTLAALLLAIVMRQLTRLQVARERFAAAVAGSDEGIWDFDFATQRVFNSARARELVGMPPGPETQPIEEWMETLPRYLHPEDVSRRMAAMQAHLAGETPIYEIEIRHRHSNEDYRWVRVRGLCVRDAAGKPVRMAGSVTDIDAAKRAEESLRRSEERFALAVAGANDGIIDWDMVNDRFYSSKRAMEIVGIDSDVTVRTREEWRSGIKYYPEDRQDVREGLERFLAGRDEVRDVGFRVLRPDGSLRWVRIRQVCVRDAGGKPLRLVGSVSDVTAEKQAVEALRGSEERFALAVEGSNDGIVDWDLVNDRMFSSKRAMEIVGIRSDVTVRTRAEWRDLVVYHKDDVKRMKEDLQSFLDGRTEMRDGVYRVLQPDGGYRWIRHRNKCVRDADGRPIRVAGSVSDIDAQVRAEAGLRESEARYQLAVKGSNQGLWDWDLLSDKLFLSPRAQEFMGLAPGPSLRPRREWIALSPYHPEDLEAVRRAISDHIHGVTPYFAVEYRIRHPSGEWHWHRQRGLALRDDRGRAYRMAGSMEDVTTQKLAEAERARLEGQLLQAKKLEAIGTLAGGIAHDFNNILSAILGYGEMAQKDSAEGTRLRRHIDAAMSAGLRAKSLVERILAFSRSGIGERKPVNVQAIVAEALDLVESSLPAGVRLERALSAGDAAVLGDPTQIHQVVMNLCANGAQAMKSKGVLAVALDVVEKRDSVAATSALPAGRYLRLAVRDTGTGIAPAILERIFDPFFTTKQVGVGTGLGLSLVHGIVTDLGGGIDVESRPGEGSTFTVYLPRSGTSVPSANIEESVPNGAGETVLLVDDEEGLVRLGEEMIAGLGYEPVGFASASVALETFRASPERFDAVLSDEAMPDMTGSELVREIRAIRPDVPVVLMSGFVSPALLERARDLGVAEVLAKPLVARDIARGLASALRNGGHP